MTKIYAITDYKSNFGSKWKSLPYRSGYNKEYLKALFSEQGYQIIFITINELDLHKEWNKNIVLYTSSEEHGLNYKSYIEDIVYGLKLLGANLLPKYEFLKANNNKVFMEILRSAVLSENLQTIQSQLFGTYEELTSAISENKINYPCVVKKAEGAMSRGVFLAANEKSLRRLAKKVSHSGSIVKHSKEAIRKYKHKGYQQDSEYQNKFIIQPFVPGLTNDWKILIYAEKYFILKRNIHKNDFRASGSGLNYTSGSESNFPFHMLVLVRKFYMELEIPHLSVDFAYDGERGYILEFQGIHFGTSTHYKSKDYYEYKNGEWILKSNDIDQEQIYVHSIVEYLKRKNA